MVIHLPQSIHGNHEPIDTLSASKTISVWEKTTNAIFMTIDDFATTFLNNTEITLRQKHTTTSRMHWIIQSYETFATLFRQSFVSLKLNTYKSPEKLYQDISQSFAQIAYTHTGLMSDIRSVNVDELSPDEKQTYTMINRVVEWFDQFATYMTQLDSWLQKDSEEILKEVLVQTGIKILDHPDMMVESVDDCTTKAWTQQSFQCFLNDIRRELLYRNELYANNDREIQENTLFSDLSNGQIELLLNGELSGSVMAKNLFIQQKNLNYNDHLQTITWLQDSLWDDDRYRPWLDMHALRWLTVHTHQSPEGDEETFAELVARIRENQISVPPMLLSQEGTSTKLTSNTRDDFIMHTVAGYELWTTIIHNYWSSREWSMQLCYDSPQTLSQTWWIYSVDELFMNTHTSVDHHEDEVYYTDTLWWEEVVWLMIDETWDIYQVASDGTIGQKFPYNRYYLVNKKDGSVYGKQQKPSYRLQIPEWFFLSTKPLLYTQETGGVVLIKKQAILQQAYLATIYYQWKKRAILFDLLWYEQLLKKDGNSDDNCQQKITAMKNLLANGETPAYGCRQHISLVTWNEQEIEQNYYAIAPQERKELQKIKITI